MKRTLCLGLAVLCVLGSGACRRKSDEAAAEKIVARALAMSTGQRSNVDVDGDKVSITTDEGTVVMSGGENAQVPDNFPKDVPIYKGASVLFSAARGDGFSVALKSADAVAKVTSFYKQDLESNGWTSDSAINLPNRSILSYRKENRNLSVMIAGDEETTQITLAVAQE